jgi:uncharacterized YceG family protein
MDGPQRRLSLPPGYRLPRRGPSRAKVFRRRLAALVVLAGLVLLAYGAVRYALDRHSASSAPVTTVVQPLNIVFPEGFTRREMAQRIAEVNAIARSKRDVEPLLSPTGFMRLTESSPIPGRYAGDGRARSLEGFLFPATYQFLGSTTTRQLVDKQLAAFRRNWHKLDLRYASSKNLTPYDVLTIASMVEKETLAPEERSIVAAVIYNRLHEHMPLGIDATLRYGLNLAPTEALGPYIGSRNRYNTRRYQGLPPTPIANPGLASMQAAAHPAKVGYLYFLRKPDKVHHYFTRSYADFVAHERAWGYIK